MTPTAPSVKRPVLVPELTCYPDFFPAIRVLGAELFEFIVLDNFQEVNCLISLDAEVRDWFVLHSRRRGTGSVRGRQRTGATMDLQRAKRA